MTLYQQIKADQIAARKSKDSVAASVLTTLLGEAGMVGKNAGNRESTDDEVMAVVKKFVKNITETLDVLNKDADTNMFRIMELTSEQNLLMKYLPQQLSADQLDEAIKTLLATTDKPNVGTVMKGLTANYAGQFDGKSASQRIKELIG